MFNIKDLNLDKNVKILFFKSLFTLICRYALATTLSALYGKLIVVMGIAFPMAEVISSYIPPSFYEAFYLYLYFGSMIFLLCMYAMMLKNGKPKQSNNIIYLVININDTSQHL